MKADFNSTKNQDIKGKLIAREVFCNASVLLSELGSSESYRDSILELFFSTPNYDTCIENWLYSANDNDKNDVLDFFEVDSIEDIEQSDLVYHLCLDVDYYEPYEFWIVSDWFGDKLKEHDQIVEEFMGFTIWGRLTTGQAILLDNCISLVAKDMEILDGMNNQW